MRSGSAIWRRLCAVNWRGGCGKLIATSEPVILRPIQVGMRSADGSQSNSGSRPSRLELMPEYLRHIQTRTRDR